MKELIPLANAHITQQTTKNGKLDWTVEENKTNEVLGVLPKELTDKQIFIIMDFARKYELLALNIGMNYMRDELKDNWKEEKEKLLKVIKELEAANEKLAEAFERSIS